jgi:integral membrane sensor domain MASE1/GAF domain-containing protein
VDRLFDPDRRTRQPWILSSATAFATLVATAYAAGAVLSWQAFGADVGFAFFPPAGVTLAALVWARGRRRVAVVGSVVVVELIVDLAHGLSLGAAGGYALANAVEPIVGATLLTAGGRRLDLGEPRDGGRFLWAACGVGPLVGALIGATVKSLDGPTSWWQNVGEWWAGDGIAVLTIGGAILVAGSRRGRAVLARPEAVLLLGLALAGLVGAFETGTPPALVVLPLIVWGAARFGLPGVSAVVAIVALVTNYETASGNGSVLRGDAERGVVLAVTQAFVAVIALVAWLLAYVIRTRSRAEFERSLAQMETHQATRLLDAQSIASDLKDCTSPRAVAMLVTTRLRDQLECSVVTMNLLDAESGRFQELVGEWLPPTAREIKEEWTLETPTPGPVAVQTGNPWFFENRDELLLAFPETTRVVELLGAQALATVPLRFGSVSLGYLAVWWSEPHPIDPTEREYLGTVSEAAGTALGRITLESQRDRRRRRAERLAALSGRLSVAADSVEVAQAIVDGAGSAVDADVVVMGLVPEGPSDPDGASIFRSGDVPEIGIPLTELSPLRSPLYIPDATAHGDHRIVEHAATHGVRAMAVFPLSSGAGRLLAGVRFGWRRVQPFDLEQRAELETVASLCAQALDRAHSAQEQRRVAVTLQMALLGAPDVVEGLETSTRYLPAGKGLEIGGDWYDVVDLGDDRALLVVGDVAGHDLEAAATMGHLRTATRALAPIADHPMVLLGHLESTMQHEEVSFATMAVAHLDLGTRRLDYCCAGHPPPLLIDADGSTRFLGGARTAPVGVGLDHAGDTASVALPPGSTVVLYTDGLIERRGRTIEDGLEWLAVTARSGNDLAPDELCSLLLRDLEDGNDDDVVVMVVRPR